MFDPIPLLDEPPKEDDEDFVEEKELDKLRSISPVIWRRVGTGIKIEDCKKNRYEEAVRVVLDHCICEDLLFRISNIRDEDESLADLRQRLLFFLGYNTSLIAVEEQSDEVVGVLILQSLIKRDFCKTIHRAKLKKGVAMQKIINLINALNRNPVIYDYYKCKAFLRIYWVAVKPNFRGQEIGRHLLRTTLDVARHLRLKAIVGIFSDCSMQTLMKTMGMEVLNEIVYSDYFDKYGELMFSDPGPKNKTCVLMGMLTPVVVIPPVEEPPKKEDKGKKGKKGK